MISVSLSLVACSGERRTPPASSSVYLGASAVPTLAGIQTVGVPVGGGAVFEARLAAPGDYPFVSHAFADATKGSVGVLRAK
jgi:hypothetical protein